MSLRGLTAVLCAALLLAAGGCAETSGGAEEKTTAPVSASGTEEEPELVISLGELGPYTVCEAEEGLEEGVRETGDGAYYCFRQGGKLYRADVCGALSDCWPDRWEASRMRFSGLEMEEGGQSAVIYLRLPVEGSAGDPLEHGFDAERLLVFEGDEVLVYRSGPETVDHVLESVEAPEDVIDDARALGETGGQYRYGTYEQCRSWGEDTEWRIAKIEHVTLPVFNFLDVPTDVYRVEYEICGDRSLILSGSEDVTLKEGGWAGGFANSVGWLVYRDTYGQKDRLLNGPRTLLDCGMYGTPEISSGDFLWDYYFPMLTAQGLLEWPEDSIWRDFGEVLRGEKEFVSVYFEKRLTIDRVGEAVIGLEEYWPLQSVSHFAMVDLDRDGVPEVILEIEHEGLGTNYYLILHWQDGEVYSYSRGIRTFLCLKADGSFQGSGGASTAYFFSSLIFSEDGCGENMVSHYSGHYDDEHGEFTTYYIGEEEVAEREFNDFMSSWCRVGAAWYAFTPERIAMIFGD